MRAQEYLQKPIWDYVIEGSKKKIGLWLTYLPNPWSGILMPRPPCRFLVYLFTFSAHNTTVILFRDE